MSELEVLRLRGIINGVPTVQVPAWMWNEVLKVLKTLEVICDSRGDREKNAA